MKMMKTKKSNEDAVSPVIGVIMMVAVTVILAAIIASYVFGMAGNLPSQKNVAFTLTRLNATAVSATCYGGSDISVLTGGVNSTVDGGDSVEVWEALDTGIPVGATKKITTTGANQRVTLVGIFSDGTTQVLVDRIL
jgi:flagellin-like protein